MNGISLFPLTVIFKGKNTFIQNVHIMVLFPKYKRKNPFMTKVGLWLQVMVIYLDMLCSLIFFGIGKIKKRHQREKKTVLEFYLSVLQVILDIPGMELACGEVLCIFLIFQAREY